MKPRARTVWSFGEARKGHKLAEVLYVRLAQGLKSAFSDRLTYGRQIVKTILNKLVVKALASPLAMTRVPLHPESFCAGELAVALPATLWQWFDTARS